MTEPSAQDLRNAENRRAIADRQAQEYGQVLAWAMGKFGPGWLPNGRHYLLDKQVEDDCRKTGERPVAAATCYTVRNCVGRKRHFMVNDGVVKEVSGYAEGFGDMLNESHPTMTIEVRGQRVAPGRFSLCWGAIELYTPQSAESLAAARERREERKVDKDAIENPLFSEQILAGEWRPEKKPRER